MTICWRRIFFGVVFGLVTLFLLSAALYAHAGEATVSWTAPTQNCDGSQLTDLSGYELRWGQGTALPAKADTAYLVQNLPPGEWWFSVASLTTGGEKSQFVTVTKVIPPEEFKTVGTVVYTFIKNEDRILVLPVGTVALGVACDATQTVNGKHVVPRSAVTWTGSVRPVVALADCG